MTTAVFRDDVTALDTELEAAFPSDATSAPDPEARLRLLRELHAHYLAAFTPPEATLALGDDGPSLDGRGVGGRIGAIEAAWNRHEEAKARRHGPLPTTPAEFSEWFFATAADHEYHELCHHLRHDATMLDIALFMLAEEKVDGRFDDLIALAQIGTDGVTKMTIAHNFWDEMGNGDDTFVHTSMFDHSADWFRREVVARHEGVDLGILEFAEVYANACELLMYSLRRRWMLRGLASIGLLEQTAPARFSATVAGSRRLGVPDHVVRYQDVHVGVDEDHGREWFNGVFSPIMERNPDVVPELAMGVLIRGAVASEFYAEVQRRCFGLG